MRTLEIYRSGFLAGTLIEENHRSYVFRYDDNYFNDTSKPDLSLTLPKSQKECRSEYLFPCFFNMQVAELDATSNAVLIGNILYDTQENSQYCN